MSDAAEDTVRAYYEAIDAQHYDRFADLFAPGVVHERPDRTIEGRETLVGFMRDDRPSKDTAHEVRTVFATDDGAAVEGRLLDADGNRMFDFVDVFEVTSADGSEDARIEHIRTYTR